MKKTEQKYWQQIKKHCNLKESSLQLQLRLKLLLRATQKLMWEFKSWED
jgi:hypothetical protein